MALAATIVGRLGAGDSEADVGCRAADAARVLPRPRFDALPGGRPLGLVGQSGLLDVTTERRGGGNR
jgi:hypothetical protein